MKNKKKKSIKKNGLKNKKIYNSGKHYLKII